MPLMKALQSAFKPEATPALIAVALAGFLAACQTAPSQHNARHGMSQKNMNCCMQQCQQPHNAMQKNMKMGMHQGNMQGEMKCPMQNNMHNNMENHATHMSSQHQENSNK